MAQNVSGIIAEAITQLDTAFGNDPEGDIDSMIADQMLWAKDFYGYSAIDALELLSNSSDYDSYINSVAVSDAQDAIEAALTAALAAEKIVLQGS